MYTQIHIIAYMYIRTVNEGVSVPEENEQKLER